MPRRPLDSPDELRRLYEADGLSAPQIAKLHGCNVKTVYRRLREHDISVRPPGRPPLDFLTEDWLRDKYVDAGLSGPEIARLANCGNTVIYRKLRSLGIPIRKESDCVVGVSAEWLRARYIDEGLSAWAIGRELGCSQVPVRRKLKEFGIPTRPPQQELAVGRTWLQHEYGVLGRSTYDIAEELGCDPKTVHKKLVALGIPTRPRGENLAGDDNYWTVPGRINPRYVDGSSSERDNLKATVRMKAANLEALRRDGFKCVRCGDRSHGPGTLHEHHVRPWAGNPEARFDVTNLVTLCITCHRWVHSRANRSGEFLVGTT